MSVWIQFNATGEDVIRVETPGVGAFSYTAARGENCVRACAGIPDAELEGLDVAGLRRERLLLLAACVAVNDHLCKTFPPYPNGKSPYDKVREALSVARGEKGGE